MNMGEKMSENAHSPRSYWLVGASYNRTDDQMPRFLSEGIWENGYDDKYLDLVRSMQPGDRIAIKSSYTRKHNLPFDNRGNTVSVMAIKAIGTVTKNLNDGKRVEVTWVKQEPQREWYFYTHRGTIWRLAAGTGDWGVDGLIAFTFDGQTQDLDRWRNAPYWRERFGDGPVAQRFLWTEFYGAVAEKLLNFRTDRKPLIEGIHKIATKVPGLSYLQDKFADGTTGPLKDICPFTAMGTFNRSMTDTNRKAIAAEMATLLGVSEPVPDTFDGIPVLNNQKSWFFGSAAKRGEGDIDALWRVFAAAAEFVGSDIPEHRAELALAYDAATRVRGVKWNITTGLYWAHPWDFATLDLPSRSYIEDRLNLPVTQAGQKKTIDAKGYLALVDNLNSRFSEDDYPVHSFPELSLASWKFGDQKDAEPDKLDEASLADLNEAEDQQQGVIQPPPALEPYSVANILKDGCFLSQPEIERLLERLRTKKNLILQGPPGTGKTWIAKRLAYALIGEKDDTKIRAVQFHPNLSYEDFVRGWRPTGEGKLALTDGVFMEAIRAASKKSTSNFVVVIEEINRGNPAQIFGELLTLLEAGKRTPTEALELCYPDADGKRRPVHVPENLYVIGTMNIADRSLALVDLAFRRRFAFVTLEPKLGDAWRGWVIQHCGVDPNLVPEIEQRLSDLNQKIEQDLGAQFRIGHSYVTPNHRLELGATREWFAQVAETEIGPLLEEYWFDSPKTAKDALEKLIAGW
ncbi:McrB family protein [Gemmobacter nectariphilus]|uniref:McrB family protein n=1 Tax=Gemmobacter nectariphilus TaxID=220343 RepID=UPI0004262279|nr:AAA family ATPase [Gemmobacter nectariphilus]